MISSATPTRERRHQSRSAVATWSLRLRPVQLGADVAGQLGDPPLDRRVDVLVPRREHEDAGGELLLHHIERVHQRRHFAIGEDAHLAQSLDMGAAPARSSRASSRSKGRLTVKSATASAMPVAMRPFQSVTIRPSPGPRRLGPDGQTTSRHRGPTGARTPPRRRGGMFGRVVGGQSVVVERHRAAPAHHRARARSLEAQTHLTGDVTLALGDERLQCVLQRRVPQAVVDQSDQRGSRAPSRGAGPARTSGPRDRRGPRSTTARPGTHRPPGS